MFFEDTIAAISTAVGEGGIGIIRISGPQAVYIADQLFSGNAQGQTSHTVQYGHILAENGAVVDEVLLLVMRAPRSYTTEDVVEIHCHGGSMSLQKIVSLILATGARLAEPGEFTKRAFLNGRLDLCQAEAVMDVIRAKTQLSLRNAVQHLGGALSGKISDFRQQILQLMAQLEAAMDFPEEDLELMSLAQVSVVVAQLGPQVAQLIATAKTGRILREGLKTVIIGKPNVGKSSLMNVLVGDNRSIVTPIPGTTRDIIEEVVNMGGIPLQIVDTAGIHETADVVEALGVDKAREVLAQADLLLLLLDASGQLTEDDRQVLKLLDGRQGIVIINKTDLPMELDLAVVHQLAPGKAVIPISALDGTGLAELSQEIVSMVFQGEVGAGEAAFVSRVRQVHLLEQAFASLQDAATAISAQLPVDCVVVDLRNAWDKLGEISGDTVGEDLLDQIFSQFCIGK